MSSALTALTTILTSWPAWVGIAVIVGLSVLRAPLDNLIRRVTAVTPKGLEAATPEGQRLPAGDIRRAADEALRLLDNPHVAHVRSLIEADVTARGLHNDPTEATRVLTGYLANALVAMDFERLYGALYGTQLQLLMHLNAAPAHADELQPFYKTARAAFPALFDRYPFEQYVGYLVGEQLVVETQGTFELTPKGRAFLQFLIIQGRSLARLF